MGASINPRIGVTVSKEQHELLMKLGALQGRSASSYLREMLDSAMPMLEAMLPVFEAAAQQVAMQPQALAQAIKDALAEVDAKQAQMSLLGLLAGSQAQTANDLDPAPGQATGPSGAREDVDLAQAGKGRRKA